MMYTFTMILVCGVTIQWWPAAWTQACCLALDVLTVRAGHLCYQWLCMAARIGLQRKMTKGSMHSR